MDSPSVLLTDGDMRVTLPVLRSLARKGIETVVAATHPKAISFFSKYCKRRALYPSSRENLGYFLKGMRSVVQRTKCDMIFPVGEWTLIPISEHRDEVCRDIAFPWVGHETILKTFDKSKTIALAEKEGVPTPKSVIPHSIQELEEVAHKISYPAVIKPRWSWVWVDDKAVFRRPSYVNTPSELVSEYKTVHEDFPFPLVQEYIPGKTFDVAAILSHSNPRTVCCIEEHRAHPITGGYSSFRESDKLDPKMRDYALRLFKALEWHGVGEVEFKLDPRDGVPKLMEIIGRFWGSLEVAIAAGIDFPYLFYRLAVDGDIKPVFDYEVGVKRRWFEGDILHLTSVLRKEATKGVERPERWHTIKEFLKFYQANMSYDCFYREDPLPFISNLFYGEIPGIVTRKIERTINKLKAQ